MHRYAVLLLFSLSFVGCALNRTRPCPGSGDTTGYPPIIENMQCYQSKAPNGAPINQGQFYPYYPSGKLALAGEFQSGRKNAVERSIPDSARKLETKGSRL